MAAVRAVVFDYEPARVVEASSRPAGLSAWLGGGSGVVRVRLEVGRVKRVGLLVQRSGSSSVGVVWDPVIRVGGDTGVVLCRFHEGPRGEPWRHRYCTRRAVTRDGYCRLHAGSWKALYERCAQGVDWACREAAGLLPGGEEFAVYVLDYGGSRVKVGLTQLWRLRWRIAEQPHVAAAIVYREGLLGARSLEKKLGRHPLATEGGAVRLRERLMVAAREASRLPAEAGRVAERLATMLAQLGLEGSYEAYSVLPRLLSPSTIAGLEQASSVEDIAGRRLVVRDYWAGLLVVEDMVGGVFRAVPKHVLLHRLLDLHIEAEAGQGEGL